MRKQRYEIFEIRDSLFQAKLSPARVSNHFCGATRPVNWKVQKFKCKNLIQSSCVYTPYHDHQKYFSIPCGVTLVRAFVRAVALVLM